LSEYIKKQAKTHEVTHEFSGKQHFFKVESPNGHEHSVIIQVGCDCTYMGVQGVARGEICSHILAVFKDILEHGNINLSVGSEQMLKLKRNACTNLIRQSNRKINEIRISSGESIAHQNKKIEICKKLQSEGKHFMTEAIFETGGRADILVLDTFTAIEVVNTESNDSILKKQEKYPKGIKIEVQRC
jgi:hypothetical protein